MVSSETMGWLNHYASEVAYRRGLLAPRPPKPSNNLAGGGGFCPQCGDQEGGCSRCRQQYLLSVCRQRGLTFEQWQQYCQGNRLPGQFSFSDLGNGALVDRAAERIRRSTTRLDNVFDRAFYPSDNEVNRLLQNANQLERQFQQSNAARGFSPQQGFAPQQGFSPQQGFAPQGFAPQQNFGAPNLGSGSRGFAPQLPSQGSSSR